MKFVFFYVSYTATHIYVSKQSIVDVRCCEGYTKIEVMECAGPPNFYSQKEEVDYWKNLAERLNDE